MYTPPCLPCVPHGFGRPQRRLELPALCLLLLGTGFLGSCGGGGGGSDSPTDLPRAQTQTFSGTAVATGPNSCSGGGPHTFVATDGAIAATLLESTGNVDLVVQVCANGIDDNNCSINQTRIAVGQTVAGSRRGVSNQSLVMNPANCGSSGPQPVGPVNYRVTVTYLQ
jgi:hypothetical protein